MFIEIGGIVGDLEFSLYIYVILKFVSLYLENVMFFYLVFVFYFLVLNEYKFKFS